MAVAQIPNLPAATSLAGNELFESVQAGTSVKVTASLIQTYVTNAWISKGGGTAVTTFSGGSTGLTPNTPTYGPIVLGGVLGIAYGGTGTSASLTPGSVVFIGSSNQYAQNNGNLFWDNTHYRLGVGTGTPAYPLDVNGVANCTTLQTANPVAIAYGGTNSTGTPTAGGVVYGDGTKYNFTSAGTSGQVLKSNGASAPTWGTALNIATELLTISTLNTIPNLAHSPNGQILMASNNGSTFFSVGSYPPFTVSGNAVTWTGHNYTSGTYTFAVNPGDVFVMIYSY